MSLDIDAGRRRLTHGTEARLSEPAAALLVAVVGGPSTLVATGWTHPSLESWAAFARLEVDEPPPPDNTLVGTVLAALSHRDVATARRALAMAHTADDPVVIAVAELASARAHLHSGSHDEVEEHAYRAQHNAESIDCPGLAAMALDIRTRLDIARGLHEVAAHLAVEAVAEARAQGYAVAAATRTTLAQVFLARGQLRRATDELSASARWWRRAGMLRHAFADTVRLTETHRSLDEPARALAALRALPTRQAVRWAQVEIGIATGEALADLGRFRAALQQFDRALNHATEASMSSRAMAGLRRCATVLGEEPSTPIPAPPDNPEDADRSTLDLHLAILAAGEPGPSPSAIQARAERLGDRVLATRAAGLGIALDWDEGQTDSATLSAVQQLSEATGSPRCRRRTTRQAAVLQIRSGDGVETATILQRHAERALERGDTYDEAYCRYWSARALASSQPDMAGVETVMASGLAQAHGYTRLSARASTLARLLGSTTETELEALSDDASAEDRVLHHAAELATSGDVNATTLGDVDAAMAATAPHERSHLSSLVGRAYDHVGLSTAHTGTGPPVVFILATKEVWHRGTCLSLSRSGLTFRLLHLIAGQGHDLDREALFEAVWEQPYRLPSSKNSLFVSISRLRKRMERLGLELVARDDGGYHLDGDPTVLESATPVDAPKSPSVAGGITRPTTAEVRVTNLAPHPAPLIGHATVLNEIEAVLDNGVRLLTLSGPGGIGKSRLARRVALARLRHYATAGGVWHCDLTDVEDRSGLARCVAAALSTDGPVDTRDAVDQLGRILASRGPILLILDSAEQLLEAVREALGTWLHAAPSAVFLVTSRERLSISGERVFEVPSLSREDGTALYIDRAEAAGATVRDEDGERIGQLVQRLDGMPLAIELAAARANLLSPEQMLVRLTERFRLLASSHGHHGRHATLEATIAWSWQSLDPWERQALRQCTVFRGGFSIEAAEAVLHLTDGDGRAPWTLDVIRALRDKSLVRTYTPKLGSGGQRYALYESIRAFVDREVQDDERAACHSRHAEHFLSVASSWGGADELHRLALDRDNLTAIIRRLSPTEPHKALAALNVLRPLIVASGPLDEIVTIVNGLLKPLGQDTEGLQLAYMLRGQTHSMLGKPDKASQDLSTALELAQRIGDPVRITHTKGLVATHHKEADPDKAMAMYREVLEEYEAISNPWSEGSVRVHLATLLQWRGQMEEAAAMYESALPLFRQESRFRSYAICLGNLGTLRHQLGETASARQAFEDAIEASTLSGDRRPRATAMLNLANLMTNNGDPEQAVPLYRRALQIHTHIGAQSQRMQCLGNLGLVLLEIGHAEEARAALTEATEAAYRMRNERLGSYFQAGMAAAAQLRGAHKTAERLYDKARADAAKSAGPSLTGFIALQQATLALCSGDRTGASEHVTSARTLLTQAQDHHGLQAVAFAEEALRAWGDDARRLTVLQTARKSPTHHVRLLSALLAGGDPGPALS